MYILVGRGLGDTPSKESWHVRLNQRPKPQYLRFMSLDQFNWNEASLTARLRQMVRYLAKHVQLSWKLMQPIGFIRLIGHTDNTGHEKYNVDLGDRRAQAVKEELESILKEDILKGRIRIVILVDPSPGVSAPTADNRTKEGRACNRRVEVFITPGVATPMAAPTPPEPPIDLRRATRDAAERVEEEAERRRQQQRYNPPVPPLPPGKSLSDWLDEKLSRLPVWLRIRIRDAILKGACATLATLLEQAGLTGAEKEALQSMCKAAADSEPVKLQWHRRHGNRRRTHIGIGGEETLLGQPNAKQYRPPFTKGGEAISEKDGQKLLTILAGPSPYQDYILPVMATQGSALPKNFLRIVTNVRTQVPAPLQGLFTTSENKLVAGTIDRWTRTIFMIPAPGLRGETRLEFALHEAIHLFAHPVIPQKGSCPRICVGTFQKTYGTGFGEGATQVITEDIMAAQGISRYYRERPYDAFTPPVREITKIFSLGTLARAYFWGATKEFSEAMESRWGNAWRNVANFTSAREPKKALDEINRLEAAYHQKLWKRGPKGDFPTPSRTANFA
jgi:outer membrane protein OmpA-like peptidoglycan-associated protein